MLYFGLLEGNILYKDLSKSDDSVDLYYELPSEQSQVLCIGSSHVYCGVNPAVFWEKSNGVTCAIMATSRQSARGTYYYLLEALRQGKSEVIYVDIYGLIEELYHTDLRTIKDMRLTPTKVQAMHEIMSEDSNNYTVWDFFYLTSDSTKWQNIEGANKNYFVWRPYRTTRGFSFSIEKMNPGDELSDEVSPEVLEIIHFTNLNKKYLDKMLDLCDKYPETQVVFVRVPTISLSFDEKLTKEISEYITSKGKTFIDIDDYLDDFSYDYFCNRGHMNNIGAEIHTEWLANYTLENYGIKPLHNSKADKVYQKALDFYYGKRK